VVETNTGHPKDSPLPQCESRIEWRREHHQTYPRAAMVRTPADAQRLFARAVQVLEEKSVPRDTLQVAPRRD
jgi:hypothetical protein